MSKRTSRLNPLRTKGNQLIPPRIYVARSFIGNAFEGTVIAGSGTEYTAGRRHPRNLLDSKKILYRTTSNHCVYFNLMVLSACRGKHPIQSIQAVVWVKRRPPGDDQLPERI